MDIGAVLRKAREQALLSQVDLATRAGTSRAAIQAYEHGRVSPTVRTVDRLLAVMGLQQRDELEPLLAQVDARVDALLAPMEVEESDRWELLAPSLAQHGAHWALDGASALRAQGLNADEDGLPWFVLAFDEDGRRWLSRVFARGSSGNAVGWWDADLAEAQACLSDVVCTMKGLCRVRLVEELPAVLRVQLPSTGRILPVIPVEAVEQAFPAYAETLARWRERRT
jgi:transcriptional regulator with XRE-family HTH domain